MDRLIGTLLCIIGACASGCNPHNNKQYSVDQGDALQIELLSTNLQGSGQGFEVQGIDENPQYGTLNSSLLAQNTPYVTYTPNLVGMAGTPDCPFVDGFDYYSVDLVSGAKGPLTHAIINVGCEGASTWPAKPIAHTKNYLMHYQSEQEILLSGFDQVEGPQELSFEVDAGSGPQHGSLEGEAPHLRYRRIGPCVTSDSFKYRSFDGSEYSDVAIISMTMTCGL